MQTHCAKHTRVDSGREGGGWGMREHEVHVIEVCRGLLYAGLRGIDKFPEYTPHKGIQELTPAGFHPVDL